MRVIEFLAVGCLVSWTTRCTSLESDVPSDGICGCNLLQCGLNPDAGQYKTTVAELLRIRAEVDEFNANAPADLRPYISGTPKRGDVCSLGSLQLTTALWHGDHSRLFLSYVVVPETGKRQLSLADEEGTFAYRQVVVKYATDCLNRLQERPGHPLIEDFKMLSILNTTDITPKVYYLSPAGVLGGPPDSSRFIGTVTKENMEKCIEKGANVRFLVQEQVGSNLADYVGYLAERDKSYYSSSAFTKQMIQITRRVLRQLERIHSLGIVHADIHGGNIAFRTLGLADKRGTNDDVVLIDFEYASLFPSRFGKRATHVPRIPSLGLLPLSIWQIKSNPTGPRDDVYRLIMMLADTLSRGRLVNGLRDLISRNLAAFGNPKRDTPAHNTISEQVVAHVRVNEPWFNRSISLASAGIIASDGTVTREMHQKVLSILEQVESYVKHGLDCSYSRVDYTSIDSRLGQVVDLI